VTDIIDYNLRLLNHLDITNSFFCLSRHDPTEGFTFDASRLAGHAYAQGHDGSTSSDASTDSLLLRLILGSHLAQHMRDQLEQTMGYTSTVGISTSKLLSKLVGNVNKPRDQTTLLPPYESDHDGGPSNVTSFLDAHDVGKVPEIGFKMSHKLRQYALRRLGKVDAEPMHIEYDYSTQVTVGELRTLPGLNARVLEEVLAGPGMQRGIGFRTWSLLHGIDDMEVAFAKDTPKQISIEDSYLRMDTTEGVHRELLMLTTSLLRRMRTDLTEEEPRAMDENVKEPQLRRWLVQPKTLRLSTRPRPPPDANGKRGRASARVSRSCDLPSFVFHPLESAEVLAQRLVQERVFGLFRQLHPEKQGWDLSLINVAVTNMAETAGTSKASVGRDIGTMFRTQEKSLQPWKIDDVDVPPSNSRNSTIEEAEVSQSSGDEPTPQLDQPMVQYDEPMIQSVLGGGSEDALPSSQTTQGFNDDTSWLDCDGEEETSAICCPLCGAAMPDFAIIAHLRYHENSD
jgi:DNA polymerase iota